MFRHIPPEQCLSLTLSSPCTAHLLTTSEKDDVAQHRKSGIKHRKIREENMSVGLINAREKRRKRDKKCLETNDRVVEPWWSRWARPLTRVLGTPYL